MSRHVLALATTSHKLIEVLAANVLSPAEPPGGKGSAANQAIHERARDRSGSHDISDAAPVLFRWRQLRRAIPAVRVEVLRLDPPLIPEQVAAQLAGVDPVADGLI